MGESFRGGRLFVALDVDASVRAAATRAARQWADQLAAAANRIRVTWVRAVNLHVTLRFLGQVAVEREDALRRAMMPPWATPPFELGLGPAGVFPVVGAPRVLWISVVDLSRSLARVQQEVDQRLRRAGFDLADGAITPHLTVGRVPEGRAHSAPVRRAAETIRPEARWRVDHVTVYRSELLPGGPRYHSALTASLEPAIGAEGG